MDLNNKKFKTVRDANGNEIKVWKLSQEELSKYLKKFYKGKVK